MRLQYTYTIMKSNIGFRNFIKHDLFRIRTDVNSYEDKYNYTNIIIFTTMKFISLRQKSRLVSKIEVASLKLAFSLILIPY